MNIFKQKMLFIADVFPKFRSPKNWVKQISKKSAFRGPFDKQHAKGDQTLLKSEPLHLYHIYWSLWRQNKTFSEFIATFLTARLKFRVFETRDNTHTWFISSITDSEKQISKESTFRGLFEKQHVNSLTLLQSERHHLYHMY